MLDEANIEDSSVRVPNAWNIEPNFQSRIQLLDSRRKGEQKVSQLPSSMKGHTYEKPNTNNSLDEFNSSGNRENFKYQSNIDTENFVLSLKYIENPIYRTRTELRAARQQEIVKGNVFLNCNRKLKVKKDRASVVGVPGRTRAQMQVERKKQFVEESAIFEPRRAPGIHYFDVRLPVEPRERWWTKQIDYVENPIESHTETKVLIESSRIGGSSRYYESKLDRKTTIGSLQETEELRCSTKIRARGRVSKYTDIVIKFRKDKGFPSINTANVCDTPFKEPLYSSFTPDGVFHETKLSYNDSDSILVAKSNIEIDRSNQVTKKRVKDALRRRQELLHKTSIYPSNPRPKSVDLYVSHTHYESRAKESSSLPKKVQRNEKLGSQTLCVRNGGLDYWKSDTSL